MTKNITKMNNITPKLSRFVQIIKQINYKHPRQTNEKIKIFKI